MKVNLIEKLQKNKVFPIIRNTHPNAVRDISHALIEGGLDMLEITVENPKVFEIIKELSTEYNNSIKEKNGINGIKKRKRDLSAKERQDYFNFNKKYYMKENNQNNLLNLKNKNNYSPVENEERKTTSKINNNTFNSYNLQKIKNKISNLTTITSNNNNFNSNNNISNTGNYNPDEFHRRKIFRIYQ